MVITLTENNGVIFNDVTLDFLRFNRYIWMTLKRAARSYTMISDLTLLSDTRQ
jgi:hypothetical protein